MHSCSSFSSLVVVQSKRFSNVSSAQRPALSLCVVITSLPPMMPATSRARSLAPPICPESTEIAFSPKLSTHTTAGSSCLSLTNGAMVRTQMPIAPIKIKASCCCHSIPTSERWITLAFSSLCSVEAISLPASLICIIAIFISSSDEFQEGLCLCLQ